MRARSIQVIKALQRDPKILQRFWSRVEKSEAENGCWEWTGRCSQPGYPSFQVGQWSIAPTHLTWFSSTGALPLGGRIHRLCENSMCVRPSHLAWIVGRVTERRLQGDGYESLAGVRRTLENPPPRSPHIVRMAAFS
jgi:hypothetical protein